jgi:carboxylesterase
MDDKIFSEPDPFDFYPQDDSSPGVLLIHGFTGTPAELRYMGRTLAAKGVGAHCPLLKGHGTRVADLGRTGWRDWLGTVERKVEALREIYSPENFYIAGLSMGALLAIRMFARFPDRFAGLIVMAVPLRLARASEIAIWCYRMSRLPIDLKIPKLGGPDVMDERVRELLPSYRHHSMRAAVSLQEFSRGVRSEDLPRLEGYVLLLHGRFDITTPLRNTEIFRHEAPRAKVAMKVFPRSGHLVPVDFDRDAVSESVMDFIRRKASFMKT